MIIVGIFGFIALSLNVIGFQYGDATKVAWLEYIIILFSFIYQIWLFDDTPNELEIVGLLFIIFACFLSLFEELYNHLKNKQLVSHDAVAESESFSSTEFEDDQGSNLVYFD